MAFRRMALAVAGMLAACALAAPTAGAQSFGTNMNGPANSAWRCPDGYGSFPGGPQGVPTCTWYALAHAVPRTGVINRMQIKVGQTTGPMQFVVARYLRQFNSGDASGPFWAGESQVFTPPANATTTIPVRLNVMNELAATGYYVFDAIGLNVLNPNVPIPATDTGDYHSGNNASFAYFPHISQQDQTSGRVDRHSPGGLIPLFAGTVDSCAAAAGAAARAAQCAPAGSPVPGNPLTNTLAALGLARGTAAVRGRFAFLSLACRLTTACKGRVRLGRAKASTAQKKKRRRAASYGSGRFNIAAGKTKTVKVKLSKAGRRLVRRRRRPKVSVAMILGRGKSAQVFSGQVTLRRAAVLRRKKR